MPEGRNLHRSTKDTKRWCLGKKGREHVGRYEPTDNPAQLAYRCQNCRKILKTDVHRFRMGTVWLHPDGRLRTYNIRGCKQVPFYGPGLPPAASFSERGTIP